MLVSTSSVKNLSVLTHRNSTTKFKCACSKIRCYRLRDKKSLEEIVWKFTWSICTVKKIHDECFLPNLQNCDIFNHVTARICFGCAHCFVPRAPLNISMQPQLSQRNNPKLPYVSSIATAFELDRVICALGNEFDNVLLIMRHGSSLLMVIIACVLHGTVQFSSVFLALYVLCHMEQVIFVNSHSRWPGQILSIYNLIPILMK